MVPKTQSGLYSVSVESIMGNAELSIPVIVLTETPDVIVIQDSSGVVAGQGNRVSSSRDISIAWREVTGSSVYICTVRASRGIVFSQSTIETSIRIPAATLSPAETCNVLVEAQYIAGDPYLRKENYYAFNYRESPTYYFTPD